MAKSKRSKPKKPYPSFPLTAHPNGQWCKKILGKVHFFGVWADPDAALEHYHKIAADLHAGREPAPADDGELTIKDLSNQYLAFQMGRVSTGQIGPRWFEGCHGSCHTGRRRARSVTRIPRHVSESRGSACGCRRSEIGSRPRRSESLHLAWRPLRSRRLRGCLGSYLRMRNPRAAGRLQSRETRRRR
jgi:hypothetical protein